MRCSTIVSAASSNPLLPQVAALAPCIFGGLPASIARAPIPLQPNTWSIERRQLSMRYSMIVPAAITLRPETWPLGPS